MTALLQHEHVFTILQENIPSPGEGEYTSLRDESAYKQNDLFQLDSNTLQICLHHDDFNIWNPLRRKIQNYFLQFLLIGKLLMRVYSCLKDIHFLILTPVLLVAGQQIWLKILDPLLHL